MDLSIRELSEGDWPILRQMRLASLEESPTAFWATLDVEAAYRQEQWTGFLRAAVWLVAATEGSLVGIVGILTRPEAVDEPEVVGMWVAPEARRRHIAGALLSACDRWARDRHVRALTLWIVEDNTIAEHLYRGHGYLRTGEEILLPRDETKREIRMRLTL
jgi:RimJ/RimL family protein N-acetyltransferase